MLDDSDLHEVLRGELESGALFHKSIWHSSTSIGGHEGKREMVKWRRRVLDWVETGVLSVSVGLDEFRSDTTMEYNRLYLCMYICIHIYLHRYVTLEL
jgi:hypothetical protein